MRHSIEIQNETMQKFEDYCKSHQKSVFHAAAAALSFAVDNDFLVSKLEPSMSKKKKSPIFNPHMREENKNSAVISASPAEPAEPTTPPDE